MTKEECTYKLVTDYYNGKKSDILEIGTRNCALINQFIVNGYINHTVIEKNGIDRYRSFISYKIAKKEIEFNEEEETLILYQINNKKIKLNEIPLTVNNDKELSEEFEEFKQTILKFCYSFQDFFCFKTNRKFNLILSSFVFHLFPPENDIKVFNKIKLLLKINGIIYIKIHNLERKKNLKLGEKVEGNCIKRGIEPIYLFDRARLDTYQKEFQPLYENSLGDSTEMILQFTLD